jgi:hypothetical protein|tara:strand:+ start:428 stop:706 length:279 start_codon:yes stop_codon:yes gene_type:complete
MANNYTSKYFGGATNGVVVTTSDISRVTAIHATAVTAAGTFALSDSTGDKIKFQVLVSSMSDIYIGDMGIRFDGTVSVSAPSDGSSITLILG